MNFPKFLSKSLSCFVLFAAFAATPAVAGPYADALGKKLISSTSPAEKFILVRWMFSAMSLHPDLKELSTVSPKQREEANRAFSNMVVKMLTQTCVVEAREAVKYEGMTAIQSAFQLFGQVAAREIFGNPSVAAGLADLDKIIDPSVIRKALEEPAELPSGK